MNKDILMQFPNTLSNLFTDLVVPPESTNIRTYRIHYDNGTVTDLQAKNPTEANDLGTKPNLNISLIIDITAPAITLTSPVISSKNYARILEDGRMESLIATN